LYTSAWRFAWFESVACAKQTCSANCGMLAGYRMVELLQTSNESTENDRQVAETLSAMLNGGGRTRKAQLVRSESRYLLHT